MFIDEQVECDSAVLLVGECALTSQILREKFQPRHSRPNTPSQIEDQILFLQKYVATTRQKIAYFIVLGSVSSETDETSLRQLWDRLDEQKKLEKEHWFGFGLAVIPALTEEVVGDLVAMASQLRGAFVSLDTFRKQEEKNEEFSVRVTALENDNEDLKNDNDGLKARLAVIEERLEGLMKKE